MLRVPWLDIVEVGAGGGSLAWVDEGGALRVGPQSAGAEPGPVCYGRGGTRPTVTDANVVLGYMNSNAIAGNTLSLDRQGALDAIRETIAEPLGIDVLDAAYGVTQVVNSTMMRALRAVSTERGRDPREFMLMPFGGAGPMHATALADTLGIREIRVPVYSGLFSALGLLMADYRQDYVRSVALSLDDATPETVSALVEEMERVAREEMVAQGVDLDSVSFERQADLRYGYQVSELALELPAVDGGLRTQLLADFSAAHLQAYGYRRDDPVELVNLRVRAIAPAATTRFADLVIEPVNGPRQRRDAYYGREHGMLATPVVGREMLAEVLHGPVIVEEPDTTVVVPPGWSAVRGAGNNLVIKRSD